MKMSIRKWAAVLLSLILICSAVNLSAVAEEAPATMTDLPAFPGTEPETGTENDTETDPETEQQAEWTWLTMDELNAQGYLQAVVVSAVSAPVFPQAEERKEASAELEAGTILWVKEATDEMMILQSGTEDHPVFGYIRIADIALYLEELPEEEPVIRTITVTSTLTGMEYVSVGTEIELKAELHGFLETDRYTLQWQYTPDGGITVFNAENGNGPIYHYIIDEDTFTYAWRLVLTMLPGEEPAE